MSWAEIKTALNSTLGTNDFKPLDVLIAEKIEYLAREKEDVSLINIYFDEGIDHVLVSFEDAFADNSIYLGTHNVLHLIEKPNKKYLYLSIVPKIETSSVRIAAPMAQRVNYIGRDESGLPGLVYDLYEIQIMGDNLNPPRISIFVV